MTYLVDHLTVMTNITILVPYHPSELRMKSQDDAIADMEIDKLYCILGRIQGLKPLSGVQ